MKTKWVQRAEIMTACFLTAVLFAAAPAAPAAAMDRAQGFAASIMQVADTSAQILQDRFIDINGLRLHYRETGDADAPPILILHGLTGHAWEFDRLARSLSSDYHVYSLNQRGHGASDAADAYSPRVMADDAAAFIDSIGIGPAYVVGHSMGGVNGWWLAARHPEKVRRLVIIDIDPEVVTSEFAYDWWKSYLPTKQHERFAHADEAVDAYMAGYSGPNEAESIRYVRYNLRMLDDGSWEWTYDASRLMGWLDAVRGRAEENWSLLRRIARPALILRAGDSAYTTPDTARRMADEMPDARYIEIAAAGHDIHFDQFEALHNGLKNFLRE